jgi:hypothetical protein
MRRLPRWRRGALAGAIALGLAGCDLGAPPLSFTALADALVAGDVDGDGDVDIVLSSVRNRLTVATNDGTGNFTPIDIVPGDRQSRSLDALELTDLDGDGDLDILRDIYDPARGVRPVVAETFLNDGAGTFTPGPFGAWEPGTLGVASFEPVHVTDLDGDGIPDLVASGFVEPGGFATVMALGDGTGAFGPPRLVAGVPLVLGAGDMTGDGAADLVAAEGASGIRVHVGDGTGAFVPGGTVEIERPWGNDGYWQHRALVADADGDGAQDVVYTGLVGVAVALGDGEGGLGPAVTSWVNDQRTRAAAVADIDDDGVRDLALVVDGGVGVAFGTGGGAVEGFHVLQGAGRAVVAAELDGDGRTDLATLSSPSVLVFPNRFER